MVNQDEWGSVQHNEEGWVEVRLTIPIEGRRVCKEVFIVECSWESLPKGNGVPME